MGNPTPDFNVRDLAAVSGSCVRIEREACIRDICTYCAQDYTLTADGRHPRKERGGRPGPRFVKCKAWAIHARAIAERKAEKAEGGQPS